MGEGRAVFGEEREISSHGVRDRPVVCRSLSHVGKEQHRTGCVRKPWTSTGPAIRHPPESPGAGARMEPCPSRPAVRTQIPWHRLRRPPPSSSPVSSPAPRRGVKLRPHQHVLLLHPSSPRERILLMQLPSSWSEVEDLLMQPHLPHQEVTTRRRQHPHQVKCPPPHSRSTRTRPPMSTSSRNCSSTSCV